MKYLIAHRGNMDGKNTDMENKPDYILCALSRGYDVEIDVWLINNKLYLGHDIPQYEINLEFLQNDKLWCHAKNFAALSFMIEHNVHCFYHKSDSHVLTSKGYIWAYTGKEIDNNTICVMPEKTNNYSVVDLQNCLGICSDHISTF